VGFPWQACDPGARSFLDQVPDLRMEAGVQRRIRSAQVVTLGVLGLVPCISYIADSLGRDLGYAVIKPSSIGLKSLP